MDELKISIRRLIRDHVKIPYGLASPGWFVEHVHVVFFDERYGKTNFTAHPLTSTNRQSGAAQTNHSVNTRPFSQKKSGTILMPEHDRRPQPQPRDLTAA
jgi:hypothetical protein